MKNQVNNRLQIMFFHEATGELMPHVLMAYEESIQGNTPLGHRVLVLEEGQQIGPQTHVVDVATGKAVLRDTPLPDPHAADSARQEVLGRIVRLEASQARAVREATLGQAGAVERLRMIDAQIATLREQL